MILGWWRDQIQGWLTSSGSDTNEPKVGARTIIVRPAISSDLSSQEHMPPASPEVSMLIPDWLWDTIQQQENQESRRRPESLPLPHPARRRGPSPPAQPPPLTTPMMTAAPEPPITPVTATTRAAPRPWGTTLRQALRSRAGPGPPAQPPPPPPTTSRCPCRTCRRRRTRDQEPGGS